MTNSKVAFPFRILVSKVISSRYDDLKGGGRPDNWDLRRSGVDIIQSAAGESLKLSCDGGQSTPHPGWVIMVTGGDSEKGYRWTLYGTPKA